MTAIVDDARVKEDEAHFLGRNDAIVRWSDAVSQMQILPGLRGLWPMSAFEAGGNAFDLSVNGRTLTYNGNPTYNYDQYGRVPYIDLDGTGDYLSRGDEAGLDITGTEGEVATAAQGLTFGGWFWVDAITSPDTLIGKWLITGNQRSYLLEVAAIDNYRFLISQDGAFAALGEAISHSGTFANGVWHHIICSWNSSDISIQVDGELENAATGLASIFNSSADFNIGARSGGTNLLNGRSTLCFLCATSLSDGIKSALYYSQKHFFGV